MTKRSLLTLTLCAALPLAGPAAADAKTKKPSIHPTISSVSPKSVGIGNALTIKGRNYLAGRGRTTVIFKRSGRKAVFVKAGLSTRKKLTVVVPEKLRPQLIRSGAATLPTKFRVRILARRMGKKYTSLNASPTILPAKLESGPPPAPPDCDNDRIPNGDESDDDNDLLEDGLEQNSLKTDACKADTDGDGVEDGYEYASAIDLNQDSCPAAAYPTPCTPALPYPSKRPYPNPLDVADGGTDFDGDWLTLGEEYQAWKRHGDRNLGDLWYSDGRQASQDSSTSDACVGLTPPPPLMGKAEWTLDRRGPQGPDQAGDGCLDDGERDEDGDFLTNFEEAHASLSSAKWWEDAYGEAPYRVAYAGTNWLDSDSDGDAVLDGMDDQDHDDFWNVEETYRGREGVDRLGGATGWTTGLWVHAFNPCLPSVKSRTCPRYIPTTGAVWPPFYRGDENPWKPRWPLWGTAGWPSAMPPAHLIDRPQ
jgi:hypothetical protein